MNKYWEIMGILQSSLSHYGPPRSNQKDSLAAFSFYGLNFHFFPDLFAVSHNKNQEARKSQLLWPGLDIRTRQKLHTKYQDIMCTPLNYSLWLKQPAFANAQLTGHSVAFYASLQANEEIIKPLTLNNTPSPSPTLHTYLLASDPLEIQGQEHRLHTTIKLHSKYLLLCYFSLLYITFLQ